MRGEVGSSCHGVAPAVRSLRGALRAWRGAEVSGLESWRCGELLVDFRARTVRFGETPVELTRREFDILAVLAGHPGWVHSSEALATADPAFYGSPTSVNVHVARLRKKLGAAGCAGLVETVRGVGYRLNPGFSCEGSVTTDPFVGRGRELEALGAALTQVLTAAEGRFVLITGEAGIGKTRVAEEFGRIAIERGVDVAWGRPIESGAPPYWSWVEVLREIVAVHDEHGDSTTASEVKALTGVMPELAVEVGARSALPAAGSPQEAVFMLQDGVTHAIAHASQHRPLLLVFDDLQWANVETPALLEFAIEHLARSRVLIVGLCRDEVGSSAALDRVLGKCAGRRQTACMALKGLSAAEVGKLALMSGAGRVDAEMAAAIMSRTGGNALFVSELLQMLAAEGGADEVLSSQLAALMPTPNMRHLVRDRVGRLAPDAVRLLEAAAVLGVEFSLPVLERVCRTSRVDVLDAFGAAVDAGLLVASDEPERLHFRHALVQQVLYLELTAATRMRLHGRAGDVLAESGDPDASRLTAIAGHYRQAEAGGYTEKAAEYAMAAGRSAMRQLGFESAVAQFGYARRLLVAETATRWPTGLLAQAEEEWGDALAATSRLVEAVDAYRASLSRLPGNARVGRGGLLGKLGRLLTETRDWVGAHEAFDMAAAELLEVPEAGRDEAWRHARIAGEVARVWLLYYELDNAALEAWVADVGGEIERIADAAELADYLGAILMWRLLSERYWPSEETVALACRGHAAAAASGSGSRLALAAAVLGYALLWSGQYGEARLRLEEGVVEGECAGAHTAVMIALAALSCLDRIEGDLTAARVSAQRCESRAIELESRGEFGAMGAANLAWIALREGDAAGVREHASRAFAGWSLAPMYSFKWAAAWPLMAVNLADGDGDAALVNARVLLEPGAQPPRGELAEVVAGAVAAAENGDRPGAIVGLRRAAELGRDFGYT